MFNLQIFSFTCVWFLLGFLQSFFNAHLFCSYFVILQLPILWRFAVIFLVNCESLIAKWPTTWTTKFCSIQFLFRWVVTGETHCSDTLWLSLCFPMRLYKPIIILKFIPLSVYYNLLYDLTITTERILR